MSSNQSDHAHGTDSSVAGSDCASGETRIPHGTVPPPHFSVAGAPGASGDDPFEVEFSLDSPLDPGGDPGRDPTKTYRERLSEDFGPHAAVAPFEADNLDADWVHTHLESEESDPLLPATPQADQLAWYMSEQLLEIDRREKLLQRQLAQFENERRQFRLLAGQRELELAERESTAESERNELARRIEQVSATELAQQELQISLLRERHELREQQEQVVADQAAIRQALADEARSVHLQLDRDREAAARDIAEEREELQREQQLIDCRRRFQEEHLQRTMRDFEQNQLAFRVEQQQARTRMVESESQLLLRRQQLDRIRRLLDEREQSVNRDQQWLKTERRGLEIRLQQERDSLRTEKANWNATRTEQNAELQRQQEQLQLHAAALETRRQQLDVMAYQVEDAQRENLELRLAVEESYAQLTRTVGEEATREKVEKAQTLLAEHYRNSRDTFYIQRQELEQLQARMATERTDLLFERKTLAEWVASEEQRLAEHDRELDQQRAALVEREAAWRQAADRWQQEKLQAETIIRNLLRQLDETTVAAARTQ
jgi:hypothetical protein